ncbi:MAG TPA: ubiquitin-conjugating enzyme E2 [Anaerolineae bacterium]|nr:ubiquitin-conjugating enzyme E2 [Anaerolineae bacterium]
MTQIKVSIWDHTESKKIPVELPEGIALRRLVPSLVRKMSLPTMQGGQFVNYELDHRRTGRRLKEDDTLRSAGVQPDDVLSVLPQVTASSGSANPRLRRLRSDHARLQKLEVESDFIRIAATDGDPPENYVIELTCRGVDRLNRGQPVFSEHHRAEIRLSAGYATSPPQMRCLTPIFHPNIGSSGNVCIGAWYAAKWLDELVYMFAEMVQYKNYDASRYNILNADAAAWARANPHLLPVDDREIKSFGEAALDELLERIRIDGEPEEDIMGQIRIL